MLEFFLSKVFLNRYKQVEGWMGNPIRYQQELLLEIIYKGCFTEFGAHPVSYTHLQWQKNHWDCGCPAI